MVVHDLDVLCWMASPAKPVSVYAIGHAHNDAYQQVEDVSATMIQLKFSDGKLGQAEVCRDADTGYDQRVEVGNRSVSRLQRWATIRE